MKPRSEQILLVVHVLAAMQHLTGAKHRHSNRCPNDVEEGTRECLTPYDTQLTSLIDAGLNFYSGVDAEVIRSICGSLFTSMKCAHHLREKCPETARAEIETVISDVLIVGELCTYSEFYEVYARHQSCIYRQQATTEQCYHSYQVQADPVVVRIYQGDENAIKIMCQQLDGFVQCVRTKVEINCGTEAGRLVDVLVRPSVRMSQHCRNDTVATTTTAVTSPLQSDQGGQRDSRVSAATKVNAYWIIIGMLALLWMLSTDIH